MRNSAGDFAVARPPLACFLPGGGIDPGETSEQTIVREAQEECGLVLKPLSRIGHAVEICYSISDDAYYEKDSTFLQALVIGTTTSIERDHELVWMSLPDALAALSHGSHCWAIERLLGRNT